MDRLMDGMINNTCRIAFVRTSPGRARTIWNMVFARPYNAKGRLTLPKLLGTVVKLLSPAYPQNYWVPSGGGGGAIVSTCLVYFWSDTLEFCGIGGLCGRGALESCDRLNHIGLLFLNVCEHLCVIFSTGENVKFSPCIVWENDTYFKRNYITDMCTRILHITADRQTRQTDGRPDGQADGQAGGGGRGSGQGWR